MTAMLLRRLQDSFAAAAGTRDVVEAGAFRCILARAGEPEYLSQAVPVAEPGDWRPAIAAMVRAFEAAGRVPRVEFFAELWPNLPTALALAGFAREREDPVMALRVAEASFAPDPACRLLAPDDPEALLGAVLTLTDRVFDFGAEAPPADRVAGMRADLASGLRTAALIEDGAPVAIASLLGSRDTAELAGVATLPERRRQGYARRVCRHLLSVLREEGGEIAWLSAGGPEAQVLYAGLGFRPVGTQLNFRGRPVTRR